MTLFAIVRRRWRWFLPLLAVLPLAIFGTNLAGLYYSKVERESLLKNQSATSCIEFNAALKERAPKSCDLALSAATANGTVVESYFFTDGSRLVHESKNGRWQASSADCTAAQRLMWVSVVGLAVFGLAVLLHSSRTGQWFYFPGMERHPMSDTEIVIAAYGAFIFAGNMFAVGAATCNAMALI
jgi:hypothetical protein